jgi:hypothetical protein
MTRWIMINWPSWLLLATLLVCVTGGTLALHVYVRRRFPHLQQGKHNDIAGFLLAIVGVVYAFIIGFTTLALWDEDSKASDATRAEVAGVVQLAHAAEAFGSPAKDRIRQAVLSYGRAMVAEWPSASVGRSAPEGRRALTRLYAVYGGLEAHGATEQAFLENSLETVRELTTLRAERVTEARTDTGPLPSVWLLILLASVLTLGFSVLFGLEDARLHYKMVGAVSLLVAANLFLVMDVSYPYLGELATPPELLQDVISELAVRTETVNPP